MLSNDLLCYHAVVNGLWVGIRKARLAIKLRDASLMVVIPLAVRLCEDRYDVPSHCMGLAMLLDMTKLTISTDLMNAIAHSNVLHTLLGLYP